MDVCAKLKGILGVKRIGHAGTLDPMAEGVLPVAVGRATKDIDLIGNGVKEYRAGMLLGIETETEDITGSIISVNGKKTDKAALDTSCSWKQALEEAKLSRAKAQSNMEIAKLEATMAALAAQIAYIKRMRH